MNVRIAGPGDVGHIVRLIGGFRDFYGGEGQDPTDQALRAGAERLVSDPATDFFLASVPGAAEPGGILQQRYRWSMWMGAEDAWIEDVFVEEPARGQGLGRALMEASAERARARGCRRIQLDANQNNAAAVALYTSLGYHHAHAADWDGAPDLYFTLEL